jgi:hypothetical protein
MLEADGHGSFDIENGYELRLESYRAAWSTCLERIQARYTFPFIFSINLNALYNYDRALSDLCTHR